MTDDHTDENGVQDINAYITRLFEEENWEREQIIDSLVGRGIDVHTATHLVYTTESSLKTSYAWGILWGLLWSIGGIVVSVISYKNASSGGTYVVFWGAVLYGLFKLFASIGNFVQYSWMPVVAQNPLMPAMPLQQAPCGVQPSIPTIQPAQEMAQVQWGASMTVMPSQQLSPSPQIIAAPAGAVGNSAVSVSEVASQRRFYYVMVRENRLGPFDHQQLVRLLTSGQITADTLVWTEGMEQWQPIRQIQIV